MTRPFLNTRFFFFFNLAAHFLGLLFPLVSSGIQAQTQYTIEGYVYEENNRGYLNQVKVTIFRLPGNEMAAEMTTNMEGYFSASLLPGTYRVHALKDIFFEKEETVALGKEKAFVKLALKRKPGYLFDATLAEVRESPGQPVDAIEGASVEIYNRTIRKTVLDIPSTAGAFFQFTFERGNHYTMLVRKEGYLTKRIEVYVNVNGCIVCVDGVRDVSPGVTDNLTAGNEMGTLLANIELDKAKIDKRIQLQHIYYDYDKWDIRPDAAEQLDHVVTLMRDNPGLSVELGSHTDCRGNDDYNEKLSQKRAQAAVDYIVGEGIDSMRISAKGYGEKALVNRCVNGVECSEEEHQQNRRTELRITGIISGLGRKSLETIILEEENKKQGKGKPDLVKSRDKQLPEANNSVKLPRPEPAVELPNPGSEAVPAPKAVLYEYKGIRILPLPAAFKGCAIELARSNAAELGADSPIFAGQQYVFHQQEADGAHAYYLANLGPCEAAKNHFEKKVKPANARARMVVFGEQGKTYTD
jgi:outer membrane protein OmpA-like peptidoglycan-associated protein